MSAANIRGKTERERLSATQHLYEMTLRNECHRSRIFRSSEVPVETGRKLGYNTP